MPITTAELVRRTAIVIAVALVPVLVWRLFGVVLIGMGAVLIAILLRLGAEPCVVWLKLPQGAALTLSGLIILGVIAGAGYLFGSRITTEFQDVLNRAETAEKSLRAMAQGSDLGQFILSHVQGSDLSVTGMLAQLFSVSAGMIEAIVISVIAGIYMAVNPKLYLDGLMLMVPRRHRANAQTTIDDVGQALRLWMLGQLIEMVLIGVLSTLAVWMIGLPSPIALGLIAGIAEFIPYLGPILASIPAILVAAGQGFEAVLWTAGAYLLIHQLEGNLIAPLIQQRLVYIPPAVILLGLAAISFLFGTIAIIFAAPIAIVLFVLVKKVYVRDSLGEYTRLPGESN